jgi:lipopolysaccharide assembly outer membrane protein LptD (OstA)
MLIYGTLDGWCKTTVTIPQEEIFSPPDTIPVDSVKTDSISLKVSPSALQSQVKFSARDSMRLNIRTKMVHLYKKADITYEDINLKADYVYIDFKTKNLHAEGALDSSGKVAGYPVFMEKKDSFETTKLSYNFDTKKGKLSDLRTKVDEGYIIAKTVVKLGNNDTYAKNAWYTTCDARDPHFYIETDKLKIVPKKVMVTGPANLMIEGVRTPLVLPFGFFPMEKTQSSGLIMPLYGVSASRGFNLRGLGYYFALSKYMDLTLKADIYSRGSVLGMVGSNYVKRYKFSGSYSFEVFKNAKDVVKENPAFEPDQTFFVKWQHRQESRATGSSFSADVNAGSSKFLRTASYNPTDILRNVLQSSVAYNKDWHNGKYHLTTALRHTQNLTDGRIDLDLPDLGFTVSRLTPFNRKIQVGRSRWYEEIGITPSLLVRNSIHTYDSLLFDTNTFENMQNGLQLNLPVNTQIRIAKNFTLSPSVSYSEVMYLQTIERVWDQRDLTNHLDDTLYERNVPGFRRAANYSAGVSLGTNPIYGTILFKNIRIMGIRHIMSPSVSFNYAPDLSQPKYGYYKKIQTDSTGNNLETYSIFSKGIFGGPAMGERGEMNFSLQNSFEMKVKRGRDTTETIEKVKLLDNLGVTGGYNFLADSLNLSIIRATARTMLFKRVSVQMDAEYDPYAVDTSGRRFNQFEWATNRRLARMSGATVSINTSLNPDAIAAKRRSNKGTEQELAMINRYPDNYIDFNIPWDLRVGYYYRVSGSGRLKNINHSVTFTGDLKLTDKWKLVVSSGYDFVGKGLTLTTVDLYRDLHCWEFSFQWITDGPRKSFNFGINVKSQVLQDLKLNRRRDWFDN